MNGKVYMNFSQLTLTDIGLNFIDFFKGKSFILLFTTFLVAMAGPPRDQNATQIIKFKK